MQENISNRRGLIALSPLFVFLCVYLISSIVAHDFYAIPVSSAFLIATVYAMAISKGNSLESKIATFSEGAGNKNVLLMIWIFAIAGAFAANAKEIGAIDATVNLAISVLPGKFIFAGLFLAACFISMSIGTSVGTIVALVPIAPGIAEQLAAGGATGFICSPAFVTAIIVGGSFFGDNLSFISDTTIAATKTQNCSMKDKFKVNFKIVMPAALLVCILYVILGQSVNFSPETENIKWLLLIPYVSVIGLALSGVNVIAVLSIGIALNAILGFSLKLFTWSGFLGTIGSGISEMGDLIIVTLLAGGMLELIRTGGGLDYIVRKMTEHIKNKRGAEMSIAALVSLANLCTANNTIAIITVGGIARDISKRFSLDPRKVASILDTFSCLIQGIIPYGAQMLLASGLAGISTMSISSYLYYPIIMGLCAILAILIRRRD
jgi:Na+/H+ antiporter NhaC